MNDDYLKSMFHLHEYTPTDIHYEDKYGPKLKKALEYAHEIRKFEIGMYWKRAQYFWGFQVSIFAGYALISAYQSDNYEYIAIALATLGLLISFAWLYVHKGAKSWQENWENHIDTLENMETGNLYRTVLGKRDSFYSVSRANKFVIISICIFWSYIIILSIFSFKLLTFEPYPSTIELYNVFIAITLLIMIVLFLIDLFNQQIGKFCFRTIFDKKTISIITREESLLITKTNDKTNS